jgi:hypothetical protein
LLEGQPIGGQKLVRSCSFSATQLSDLQGVRRWNFAPESS